jgi:hypothetical protein
MPKGSGSKRDLRKKPTTSLKEKRSKKREKKMRLHQEPHIVDHPYLDPLM